MKLGKLLLIGLGAVTVVKAGEAAVKAGTLNRMVDLEIRTKISDLTEENLTEEDKNQLEKKINEEIEMFENFRRNRVVCKELILGMMTGDKNESMESNAIYLDKITSSAVASVQVESFVSKNKEIYKILIDENRNRVEKYNFNDSLKDELKKEIYDDLATE